MDGQFRIGPWLVQPSLNLVFQNGTTVRLEPKVMEVLVCLARRAGEPVTKDELIKSVWPATFVTDDVLKRCIWELRRVFEDDAREPRFIETIPKRGYRLLVPLEEVEGTNSDRSRAALKTPGGLNWRLGFAVKMIAGATLSLAVLASAFYFRSREPLIGSLAVLPFTTVDPHAGTDLGDGLTSGLIDSLSRLPNLRVISRNAVSRYKEKEIDPGTAGRELHVQAVLIGSITPDRDGLILDAELVNVGDDTHLWGQRYSGKPSDILILQTQLARAISDKLRPRVSGEEKNDLAKPGTSSLQAYSLYVKGRFSFDQFDQEHVKEALTYFRQSADEDPGYPEAYGAMGEAYAVLAAFRSLSLAEGTQKAKAAAKRALELNPNSADGHCGLAGAAYVNWKWVEAENESRLCVELNPSAFFAHQLRAWVLQSTSKLKEGLAQQQLALEVDPVSFAGNSFLADAYYYLRDYDRAIELKRKLIELEPRRADLYGDLAESYLMKGEYDEAAREFEMQWMLQGKYTQAQIVHDSYTKGGFSGLLRAENRLLSDPEKTEDYCPDVVAGNYALLGQKENAFLWLDRAYTDNDKVGCLGNLLPVQVDPLLENIHNDPRFKAFLRRMGFPQVAGLAG